MAKIPLRAYNREIENLIDRGQIEEAIAHCKNILKQFPKYIETYRLLGKAYLESQRYSEAADILQRVLSVIPDDFVSQLGMSIIREDEGNLDASIWHMERAYEVQPFNRAVQDELRRLYGRRDGSEPPKVRLTRGSLVRMYARGELYPQAIAECRAALAEDSQRLDLLVLLARMYYLSGQKLEATEICSSLIGKLPYCYEANRVLMEILPGTSRAEDAKTFQQRVYQLDAYAAFISPNAPTSAQVPDQTVSVERVEWQPSMQDAQGPEWAKTIGVQWEEKQEENLPDWLNTLNSPDAPGAPAALPPVVSAQKPIGKDDIVPDWMKSGGWDRSSGEPSAPPAPVDDSTLDDLPIAEAEIPDWLQNMAPKSNQPPETEEEISKLDLLSSILPAAGAAAVTSAAVPEPTAVVPEPTTPDQPTSAASPTDESVPDWLSEMNPSAANTLAAPETAGSDLPAWLTDLGIDNAPAAPQTPPAEQANTELEASLPSESPDWLQDLRGPESSLPTSEAIDTEALPTEDEITPLADDGSIPAWMREITLPEAETPSETEDGTVEKAAAPADDLPDWLRQPEDQLPTDQLPAVPAENLPEWLRPPESETPTAPESIEPQAESISKTEFESQAPVVLPVELSTDENVLSNPPVESPPAAEVNDIDAAMAWMEALAAKQGADQDSLKITAPDQRTETTPDWLAAEPTDTLEPAVEAELPVEPTVEIPTPEETPAAEISAEGPAAELPIQEPPAAEVNDIDAAMAWMEALAAKQGADQDSLKITAPEQRTETTPDWLAAEPTDTLEPAVEAQLPVEPTAEIPTPEETPAAEISAEGPAAELPIQEPPAAEVNDIDAAMAWMEALAAKQGADQDSLKITAPEQRTETTPDWLAAEPTDTLEPAVEAQLPVEPTAEIPTPEETPAVEISAEGPAAELPIQEPPAAEVNDIDAAMAWMEALAAKQGADQDSLKITAPEQRTETTPDWLAAEPTDTLEPAPQDKFIIPEIPPAEGDIPTQPVHISVSTAVEEPADEPILAAPTDELPAEEDAFAWLESLAAKQGAQDGTLITTPEERQEKPPEWVAEESLTAQTEAAAAAPSQPEAWAAPAADESSASVEPPPAVELEQPAAVDEPEMPDWLRSYEEDQQKQVISWTPSDAQQSIQPSAIPDETVPDWLKAEPTAPEPSTNEDDTLPGWLKGIGEAEPEVTTPDTQPVEQASEWIQESQIPTTPHGVLEEMPASLPLEPASGPRAEALSALENGQVQQAVQIYQDLLASGSQVQEVVTDLQNAVNLHPQDANLWQVLGDAFIQCDRVQDALDAYTKAEKLLR